ncbi:MAG: HAD family hydrolase [Haloarculaceae archaeon]
MEHDAVVYDLDGTLVRLEVDWDAAASDAAAVLRARGIDVEQLSLWDMLETAAEQGFKPRVSTVLAAHEREGALNASAAPVADELPRNGPVGVCSLNAEAACRVALEVQGLDAHVDAVVGRDSLEAYKPDPEPLLHTLSLLDADPEKGLFVGDGERDRETARRAGVEFRWVEDR